MVTVKEKIKLLSLCLGDITLSNSHENVNAICPLCDASGKITSKKKLSINIEKGIYHCWVCNDKGRNIGKFCLKNTSDTKAAKTLLRLYGGDRETQKEEANPVLRPSLPEDFVLLYDLKNSKTYRYHYQYLIDRGFDELKMKKFRIGASSDFKFLNRVIFPSFDINCNLNYFVSRIILPDSSYRYKNFEGSRKDVIFRHADLDFKKPMVLVEGVFDLVNCPKNSTCILGSWIDINYAIFKEIVKHKTPVTLCLDPDAIQKTLKIAKNLASYCIDVRISQHTSGDFGEMSKETVEDYIQSAKHFDNANFVRYLINNMRSGSMF